MYLAGAALCAGCCYATAAAGGPPPTGCDTLPPPLRVWLRCHCSFLGTTQPCFRRVSNCAAWCLSQLLHAAKAGGVTWLVAAVLNQLAVGAFHKPCDPSLPPHPSPHSTPVQLNPCDRKDTRLLPSSPAKGRNSAIQHFHTPDTRRLTCVYGRLSMSVNVWGTSKKTHVWDVSQTSADIS